ncbi:MAG: DUF4430 domain-containing protein [bacterium]
MLRWLISAILLLVCGSQRPSICAEVTQGVAVEIEIVADSANSLAARVQVSAGTAARDLMERLFKIEYLDSGRKFVVSIAGYKAPPREQKFWKLEVDGTASQVGIAEIVLNRPTRLRWVITAY